MEVVTRKDIIDESNTNRSLYNQNNDIFNDTNCKFESNDITDQPTTLYNNTYEPEYTSLPESIKIKDKIVSTTNNYCSNLHLNTKTNVHNNINTSYQQNLLIDTSNINEKFPTNNLVNITSKYSNIDEKINFDDRNFLEGYKSPYIDGDYIVNADINLPSSNRFTDSTYWTSRDPRLMSKSISVIDIDNSFRIRSRNKLADNINSIEGELNINDTVILNTEPKVNDNYTSIETNDSNGNIIHSGIKNRDKISYKMVNNNDQILGQSIYYYDDNIDETVQNLFNNTSSELHKYTNYNYGTYNSFKDMSKLDLYNKDAQNYNETLTPYEKNIMMRRNEQIASSIQSLNRNEY